MLWKGLAISSDLAKSNDIIELSIINIIMLNGHEDCHDGAVLYDVIAAPHTRQKKSKDFTILAIEII